MLLVKMRAGSETQLINIPTPEIARPLVYSDVIELKKFGFSVRDDITMISGIGATTTAVNFIEKNNIRAVYGTHPDAFKTGLFEPGLDTLSVFAANWYSVFVLEVGDRDRLVRHLSRLALAVAG